MLFSTSARVTAYLGLDFYDDRDWSNKKFLVDLWLITENVKDCISYFDQNSEFREDIFCGNTF